MKSHPLRMCRNLRGLDDYLYILGVCGHFEIHAYTHTHVYIYLTVVGNSSGLGESEGSLINGQFLLFFHLSFARY